MTTPKTIAEAYADAARPAMTDREAFANDEWEPESPDYIRGWNDCMMKTHKLVPIETPAMTGVKVKPLVWSAEDNGEFIAVAEVGWYHIGRPASSWNLTTPFGAVLSFWDDLDAAKAAAQADYESRILAAIVPPADLALLSDPNAVHLNMLRGSIAKPTIAQIIHIYGIDALCKALAPEIVREAEQPAPWMPPEIAELVMTAQWARNRLDAIADESWHGDARDFKRSLIGVFADFDEALAKCGSTMPTAFAPLPGNAP